MNKLFSKFVSAVTAAAMTLFVSSSSLQTFVNEIDAHAAETDVEPVHIKIASKIIAKVRFPKYRTSSLS